MPDTPIGIDVEGHGRNEDLAPHIDLSRTVGWFTAKYPVSLTVGGLRWAQVVAGDAALGPVVKNAKEQLRALPDGLTYGLLRYLQHRCRPGRVRPVDRIQLPRTAGLRRSVADVSDELWLVSEDGLSLADAATTVPMPLGHTVELNAATVDSETGPQLHATWTWAPSALDETQVGRLSQLWFDALAGICAHVRTRRRRADPVRYRSRTAQPTPDRRAATAPPDRRRPTADPAATGTALPRQHRTGFR